MQRGLDAEIRWFTVKATLLDLHDNLLDTLYGDCYPALERLELYRSNRSGLRDPKGGADIRVCGGSHRQECLCYRNVLQSQALTCRNDLR